MGFDDDAIWPSNIKPRRIRVDRGSEFKSKEFRRICNELGIELQIVSGASGSLKGVVEQSFHQMHSRQNEHLEDNGLIEKDMIQIIIGKRLLILNSTQRWSLILSLCIISSMIRTILLQER